MSCIAAATVLIVGLRGAGVELAKNVVLTGVRPVTLLDLEPVSFADVSSQFFCTEADCFFFESGAARSTLAVALAACLSSSRMK